MSVTSQGPAKVERWAPEPVASSREMLISPPIGVIISATSISLPAATITVRHIDFVTHLRTNKTLPVIFSRSLITTWGFERAFSYRSSQWDKNDRGDEAASSVRLMYFMLSREKTYVCVCNVKKCWKSFFVKSSIFSRKRMSTVKVSINLVSHRVKLNSNIIIKC